MTPSVLTLLEAVGTVHGATRRRSERNGRRLAARRAIGAEDESRGVALFAAAGFRSKSVFACVRRSPSVRSRGGVAARRSARFVTRRCRTARLRPRAGLLFLATRAASATAFRLGREPEFLEALLIRDRVHELGVAVGAAQHLVLERQRGVLSGRIAKFVFIGIVAVVRPIRSALGARRSRERVRGTSRRREVLPRGLG